MIEASVAAAIHALIASCLLGIVLFATVALVVRVVNLDATLRHALWTIALCTTAIMPVAGFAVSAGRTATAPPSTTVARGSLATESDTVAASNVRTTSASHTRRSSMPRALRAALGTFAAFDAYVRPSRNAALAIVSVWLAGAAAGLIGLVLSLNRVRGLKRRSIPLDGNLAGELPWLTSNGPREREIYLRLSYETETPVAVGFRRPIILIPTELATQGGLSAIEGLVMHEHAHLRRYDDWTNLVQRLIERLFWFNPLVWVLGRQIALEREIASDDAVVRATGRPDEYAKSLWQLAREMRMPEHSVVAPGALFTRKQITVRIEALLERRPVTARWRAAGALAVGFTAVACTVAVAATAPAIELPPTPPVPTRVATPLTRERPAAPEHPAAMPHPNAQPRVALRPRPVTMPVALAAPSIIAPPAITPAAEMNSMIAAAVNRGLKSLSVPVPSVAVAVAPAIVAAQTSQNQTPDAAELSCSGCDLSGRDLRNRDLRGIRLNGADLSGADLRGARLDDARFTGVELSGARLDGASLVNAMFTGTNLEGASLRDMKTRGLRFIGMSLADMDLRELDLRSILGACSGCDLHGANMEGADLRGIRIAGADLNNANLRNANLSGSSFTASDFSSANLEHANMRFATFVHSSFANANLHGVDTTGANFDGTDMGGANVDRGDVNTKSH